MPPAARITDMHTCPMVNPGPVPHVGGPIIKGNFTVLTVNLPQARISDQCICVGPPDMIAKGSTTVLCGGLPAARMGDSTAHGGVIVMGAPTVLIGNGSNGGGGGGGGGAGMPGNVAFSEPNLQSKTMIAAHKEAKPFCAICEGEGEAAAKQSAAAKAGGGAGGAGAGGASAGAGAAAAGAGQGAQQKSREEIIDEAIETDPKVARDIKKDSNAIYGYAPKSDGRLGNFDIDFSDADQVASGRAARVEYSKKLAEKKEQLLEQIESTKQSGQSLDELAKKSVENRNQGRIQSYIKDNNIDGLEAMYKSNLKMYGREEGADLQDFLDKGMTHEEIILGSTKSNKGVDIVFGLWP